MFRGRGRGRGAAAAPQASRTTTTTTTTTTTSSGGGGGRGAGAPSALLDVMYVTYDSQFHKVWDDRKTGAQPNKLALFNPEPPAGFYCIGSWAEKSHDDKPKHGNIAVVRDPRAGQPGATPLLAPPTSFMKIWEDKGTGGKYGNCSLWQAIPPPGYVALGFMAVKGYSSPSANSMMCVHQSAVHPGKCVPESDGVCIWTDRKSKAKHGDVSLWSVRPVGGGAQTGTFLCSPNYNAPTQVQAYVINSNQPIANPGRGAGAGAATTSSVATRGGAAAPGRGAPAPGRGAPAPASSTVVVSSTSSACHQPPPCHQQPTVVHVVEQPKPKPQPTTVTVVDKTRPNTTVVTQQRVPQHHQPPPRQQPACHQQPTVVVVQQKPPPTKTTVVVTQTGPGGGRGRGRGRGRW